jgi:hypothetical protein
MPPRRKVHGVRQMTVRLEVARVPHVDKGGPLFSDKAPDLWCIKEDSIVTISRNGTKLIARARYCAVHGATLGHPFLDASYNEVAVDALLRERLADFVTAIAVVTERDNLLGIEIDAGRRNVRIAQEGRARQGAHFALGALPHVEEYKVPLRAGLLSFQQSVGLCGRNPIRMPHLLRVRELLDLRVAAQRAGRAGRTRQRFLEPGLPLARLFQIW